MLELIVVVAIMGIMAGVVGVAMIRSRPPAAPGSLDSAHAAIAAARREAVRSQTPVTIAIPLVTAEPGANVGTVGSASAVVDASLFTHVLRATALPDGSVIADVALRIDRFTGRPLRADPSRSAGW